jgi:hypothetical protein
MKELGRKGGKESGGVKPEQVPASLREELRKLDPTIVRGAIEQALARRAEVVHRHAPVGASLERSLAVSGGTSAAGQKGRNPPGGAGFGSTERYRGGRTRTCNPRFWRSERDGRSA